MKFRGPLGPLLPPLVAVLASLHLLVTLWAGTFDLQCGGRLLDGSVHLLQLRVQQRSHRRAKEMLQCSAPGLFVLLRLNQFGEQKLQSDLTSFGVFLTWNVEVRPRGAGLISLHCHAVVDSQRHPALCSWRRPRA